MVSQETGSSERMMAPELMVTGEAVALEIVPATVGVRVLSGLVDYGLYALGLVISLVTWLRLSFGNGSADDMSLAAGLTQVSLIATAWLVVVPIAVEVLSRGGSAGRLITGCRVVRDDGGAIRLRHSLVRVLVGVVEIWLCAGVLAIGSVAVTRRGKRLGDMLAGTYVVRSRAESSLVPPILEPPELRGWVSSADLRALPGTLTLVCRTFLQRASSLEPVARNRLAVQLAAQVESYVSPPPPWGTNPERFLASVLAERRNRELILELEDRRLDDRAHAELDHLPYGLGADAGAGPAR